LTCLGLNLNPKSFDRFYLLVVLFRVENRICLSRGVYVTGAAWWATIKILARVGDLVQMTRDGRTRRVLTGRAIERSDDAVCGLYRA
jgi:hypothetical protein